MVLTNTRWKTDIQKIHRTSKAIMPEYQLLTKWVTKTSAPTKEESSNITRKSKTLACIELKKRSLIPLARCITMFPDFLAISKFVPSKYENSTNISKTLWPKLEPRKKLQIILAGIEITHSGNVQFSISDSENISKQLGYVKCLLSSV